MARRGGEPDGGLPSPKREHAAPQPMRWGVSALIALLLCAAFFAGQHTVRGGAAQPPQPTAGAEEDLPDAGAAASAPSASSEEPSGVAPVPLPRVAVPAASSINGMKPVDYGTRVERRTALFSKPDGESLGYLEPGTRIAIGAEKGDGRLGRRRTDDGAEQSAWFMAASPAHPPPSPTRLAFQSVRARTSLVLRPHSALEGHLDGSAVRATLITDPANVVDTRARLHVALDSLKLTVAESSTAARSMSSATIDDERNALLNAVSQGHPARLSLELSSLSDAMTRETTLPAGADEDATDATMAAVLVIDDGRLPSSARVRVTRRLAAGTIALVRLQTTQPVPFRLPRARRELSIELDVTLLPDVTPLAAGTGGNAAVARCCDALRESSANARLDQQGAFIAAFGACQAALTQPPGAERAAFSMIAGMLGQTPLPNACR